MADIKINEVSENYSYVIGNESFATVALPITSIWGPGYFEPQTLGVTGEDRAEKKSTELEDVVWQRFPANQSGIEAFVSMYRGPANNYRLAKDYSYQMAMTLLSAGYDILVCRLNPGSFAYGATLRDVSHDETHIDTLGFSSDNKYIIPEIRRQISNRQETIEPVVPLKVQFECEIVDVSIDGNTGDKIIDYRSVKCVDDGKGRFIDGSGNYVSDQDGNDVTIDYDKRTISNLEVKNGTSVKLTWNTAFYASGTFRLRAKYAGSFGNRLVAKLTKMRNRNTWNLVVYIIDSTGVKFSVENKTFVFDIENSSDSVLHVDEIESDYVDIIIENTLHDVDNEANGWSGANFMNYGDNILFTGGTDRPSDDTYRFAEDRVASDGSPITDDVIATETEKRIRAFYKKEYSVSDHNMDDPCEPNSSGAVTAPYKGTVNTVDDLPTVGTKHDVYTVKNIGKQRIYDGTAWVDFSTYVADASHGLTANTNWVGPVDGVNQPCTQNQILIEDAIRLAKIRYDYVMGAYDTAYNSMDLFQKDGMLENTQYIRALRLVQADINLDLATSSTRRYQEWLYTEVHDVYDLLLDRLSYSPNRVISPGWDDQDILSLTPDEEITRFDQISPMHYRLMYVAYYARCATAYLDVPKSMKRKYVYNSSNDITQQGYAQMLARYDATSDAFEIDGTLYSTHSGLYGPWGTYRYVGTGKYCPASPAFLALMIQKSMLKNQALRYEWLQPDVRTCDVKVGKMDYTLPQKILDLWQPEPDQDGGCGVNCIGNIPSIGLSIWGDSTCYENPPAVYQALRNMSTRLLMNALKNQSYKVGLSITWNYNNETAYAKFHAGMTPLLETMKNAGAIESYYVRMEADLDKVGMVKANSCVGKVYFVPYGTIQHITVDLIAMPPGTDLGQFTAV